MTFHVESVEIVLRVTTARDGERREFLLRDVAGPGVNWIDYVLAELRLVHRDDVARILDRPGYRDE